MKRLLLIIIFSLAVVSFIIGLHQLYVNGLGGAYHIFMLSIILLLLYQFLKPKGDDPLS